MKRAIFAGGCFWCTEAVFIRLKGVENVKSGYTGGFIKNPAYREVCQERTGHTEGIRLDYDETLISYAELLEVFFATHDPTTLNRQANDVGTQYRSVGKLPPIFGKYVFKVNISIILEDSNTVSLWSMKIWLMWAYSLNALEMLGM